MNWKKLTLLSGIALVAVAVPCANAQRGGGGGSAAHVQAAAPSGARASSHGNWAGHGNWTGHGEHHWHHGYYPRYYSYYPGFYPYYGYGYPFWGASAALYYNGYQPYYDQRYGNNGGGSVVAEVQQELARGGFYRGAIDGVIGNGTRNAIRAYERANGLRVDGRIDNELLGSMGLS